MTNRCKIGPSSIPELISACVIMLFSFGLCMLSSIFIPTGTILETLYIVISYSTGIAYLNKRKPLNLKDELYGKGLLKYSMLGVSLVVLSLILLYDWSAKNKTSASVPIKYNIGVEMMYVILACIAIPFCEELFFRYYLYNGIKARFGLFYGVVVSTLLFYVVHYYHPHQFVIMIQALLYTYLYQKSNSIWSSIIVHSFNNIMWHIVSYISNTIG